MRQIGRHHSGVDFFFSHGCKRIGYVGWIGKRTDLRSDKIQDGIEDVFPLQLIVERNKLEQEDNQEGS